MPAWLLLLAGALECFGAAWLAVLCVASLALPVVAELTLR
jgi:hypothetical protein